VTVDETTEAILIAHQRRTVGSCLCGWDKLGRSHAGHQAAMLRRAELLIPEGPAPDVGVEMLREAGILR
jgi:hypothetical protein